MWTSVTGEKTDATLIHTAVTCLEPTSATVPRGDTAGDIVMVRCILRGVGAEGALQGYGGRLSIRLTD